MVWPGGDDVVELGKCEADSPREGKICSESFLIVRAQIQCHSCL
jgi:hypothetical protein